MERATQSHFQQIRFAISKDAAEVCRHLPCARMHNSKPEGHTLLTLAFSSVRGSCAPSAIALRPSYALLQRLVIAA